jgi:hypothetical protein
MFSNEVVLRQMLIFNEFIKFMLGDLFIKFLKSSNKALNIISKESNFIFLTKK